MEEISPSYFITPWLFSLKSYAKKCFTVCEIIFQSKVIPFFLPKCSKLHSFYVWHTVYLYMEVTVDFLPYMEVTVGKKKKKGKTWRNEVDTKTVKIATSETILKRNFTIL